MAVNVNGLERRTSRKHPFPDVLNIIWKGNAGQRVFVSECLGGSTRHGIGIGLMVGVPFAIVVLRPVFNGPRNVRRNGNVRCRARISRDGGSRVGVRVGERPVPVRLGKGGPLEDEQKQAATSPARAVFKRLFMSKSVCGFC